MAGQLIAALDAMHDLLSTIPGFNATPEGLPEKVASFPVLLVSHGGKGKYSKESSGYAMALHQIRVGAYIARKQMPGDLNLILPFGDMIMERLLADANSSVSGTIDTIADDIEYKLGSMSYLPLELYGWTFDFAVNIHSVEDANGIYTKG